MIVLLFYSRKSTPHAYTNETLNRYLEGGGLSPGREPLFLKDYFSRKECYSNLCVFKTACEAFKVKCKGLEWAPNILGDPLNAWVQQLNYSTLHGTSRLLYLVFLCIRAKQQNLYRDSSLKLPYLWTI